MLQLSSLTETSLSRPVKLFLLQNIVLPLSATRPFCLLFCWFVTSGAERAPCEMLADLNLLQEATQGRVELMIYKGHEP